VVLRSPTTTALASFSRRERRSVSSVVARLDRLVARDIEVEELVLQSAELLGSWNDDAQVEVWTGGDGLLRRTAAAPYLPAAELRLAEATESVAIRVVDPVGPEWLQVWVPELLPANPDTGTMFAPIVYGNRLRGALVVRGPEAIPEEVVAVLRPVAQRLGAAIHNATLSSALQASLAELRVRERELRASRERLVAAADAERARIERDLHDGAQQQLVALAVNLQLARTLVDTDPERAQRLLAELQQAARAATEELRRISHGIYPPTLRESGLGAALDEATAGSATPVHVHAPAARAPADVEAAVYFACMEAINNATKHAAASRISVTVAVDADRLAFEVVDDGSGFDVDAVGAGSGRGLRNMVDRIGAVDGAMTVDRGHGGTGTRVLGSVPLSG